MTAGTVLMSQPHVVRETAGEPGWPRGGTAHGWRHLVALRKLSPLASVEFCLQQGSNNSITITVLFCVAWWGGPQCLCWCLTGAIEQFPGEPLAPASGPVHHLLSVRMHGFEDPT